MGYIKSVNLTPVLDDTTELKGVNKDTDNFYAKFRMNALDATIWTAATTGTATVSLTNVSEKRFLTLAPTASTSTAGVDTLNKRFSKDDGAIEIKALVSLTTNLAAGGDNNMNFGIINGWATGTNAIRLEIWADRLRFTTIKASTSTTVEKAIAATTGIFYNLRAVINSAWTEVKFYINDVLETTITTNIPDNVILNAYAMCYRHAATTGTGYCDSISVNKV